MQLTVYKEAEWARVAKELWTAGNNKKLWALTGQLGSGKTTLVKHLISHLGGPDMVSSPTFSLVNEYTWETEERDWKVYHLDLYRLEYLEEALDIGIEEYISEGDLVLIEWPQIVEPLLDDDVFRLDLQLTENERIVLVL